MARAEAGGTHTGSRMDPTKLRLVMMGLACLAGLIGMILLAAALVAALLLVLPMYAALGITALLLLIAAGVLAWRGLRPDLGLDDEAREMIDLASSAALDLPVEAARKLITDRPLAAVALASGLGALLAHRPQAVGRLMEALLSRLAGPRSG